MRQLLSRIAWPVVYAHRRKVNRQAGVALVMVTVTVAILAAVVSEFNYNARVELESAANGRDQLRAEYLARSGINLSRLLIKVQQSVITPINKQIGLNIQIGDFAPFLMQAFGGEDGAEVLGGFLGIGGSSIKGLGVGKGAGFDVEMKPEDGKININCGGGLNPGGNVAVLNPMGVAAPNQPAGAAALSPQAALYLELSSLMMSPRYNRLFENADADGQFATRDDVARAIVDWTDVDLTKLGTGGDPEDYHYDTLRDPYKAKDNYFDTVDEVQLVRGVNDDFWGSFGEMLRVYGGCRVNLNAVKPENWPILVAIIRASAKDKANPALLDDTVMAAMAQQIGAMAQMFGGLQSTDQLSQATQKGGVLTPPQGGGLMGMMAGMMGGGQPPDMSQLFPPIPGMPALELDPNTLGTLATTDPDMQVYRIDATGTVKRTGAKKIEVHIRAVFDTRNPNSYSGLPFQTPGNWVYWRMD